MRRKGFTLIELMVVIAIIAILVTILLPSLTKARDLAKKATCQASLNGIGKALALYMAQNDDRTPMIKFDTDYDPATVAVPTETTQTDDDYDAGTWETTLGDNPMQNVWLLIAGGLIIEKGFTCAADGDHEDRRSVDSNSDPDRWGWISTKNYSYGIHVPYTTRNNPLPFNQNLEGGIVIFADQLPYDSVEYHKVDKKSDPPWKPSNHKKLGTAYLLFSGTVQWQDTSMSECGLNGDDIYENGERDEPGVPGGVPTHDEDTSIAASGRQGA
ncbi:hypothetical protein LCGC14_0660800 [marine sediment metagenome]|uniref:Type II secretion system protein GspG C-terminal domain-containing protein n=1 Tax=marine sediment metagenome TaxID=412755 RepID=A0A0F9QTL1_9ZZZZ|nr:type II secretion system protein [Phycisphaerae bacterium]HDZ44608.1 type II secretion system protein [Phycisphaerae bacterium]